MGTRFPSAGAQLRSWREQRNEFVVEWAAWFGGHFAAFYPSLDDVALKKEFERMLGHFETTDEWDVPSPEQSIIEFCHLLKEAFCADSPRDQACLHAFAKKVYKALPLFFGQNLP